MKAIYWVKYLDEGTRIVLGHGFNSLSLAEVLPGLFMSDAERASKWKATCIGGAKSRALYEGGIGLEFYGDIFLPEVNLDEAEVKPVEAKEEVKQEDAPVEAAATEESQEEVKLDSEVKEEPQEEAQPEETTEPVEEAKVEEPAEVVESKEETKETEVEETTEEVKEETKPQEEVENKEE